MLESPCESGHEPPGLISHGVSYKMRDTIIHNIRRVYFKMLSDVRELHSVVPDSMHDKSPTIWGD